MAASAAVAQPLDVQLPTLERLNTAVSPDIDPKPIAKKWFQEFASSVEQSDAKGVTSLLLNDAFWRDMLALTWEFRTFYGASRISKFLGDQLPKVKMSNLQLQEDSISLLKPYSDLAWIQFLFNFETEVGKGSGVIRLVPTGGGVWKAHVVFTNLEELKGFPERIGALRDPLPNHGQWPSKRKSEVNFENTEPAVVIIGAGQSGLDVAARLKLMGVEALVVDRNARVGDQWRGRYEALCLHDPVWYDHLPYLPFPPSWPVWTPAPKLADWLENYAHTMELNVWTSTTVEKVEQDPSGQGWTVTLKRGDGTTRTFKPRHVVFAHGLGGGVPNLPKYEGMDEFEGKIIHSSQHKSARDHIGKKVVIIGACTSGHDIAHDHYLHGVDVTIYQRSSTYIMSTKEGMPRYLNGLYWGENCPPVDIADRINASYPNKLLKEIHKRVAADTATADRELLEGLKKRGFRINFGEDGSGFLMLAWQRGGGYYLDVGASQLIIDGKIKLKNDSPIKRFTKNSILFEDGSELPADVVIFATGFGDMKQLVRDLVGEDVASKCKDVWGLNEEGEVRTAWRDSGVPGLYFMVGNLALCRFHSKHLALQIKALEEGIPVERYTA